MTIKRVKCLLFFDSESIQYRLYQFTDPTLSLRLNSLMFHTRELIVDKYSLTVQTVNGKGIDRRILKRRIPRKCYYIETRDSGLRVFYEP